jgi:hypothetical protein
MIRKSGLLVIVAVAFLIASPVAAQEPEPQHDDPFWRVWYWNNVNLSGLPAWAGQEQSIVHDWGEGSPRSVVRRDYFSARWSRYIETTEAGTYRFTATSDDGIRITVDGRLVVNGWYDHPVKTFTGDVHLSPGHHEVVVEYYEKTGRALAKVGWTGPFPAHFNHWRGEYFGDRNMTGEPVMVRDDEEIAFDWGMGSPADIIPNDRFAVRWTRYVELPNGRFRFTATSDDGIRVWVDDRLIIDEWYDHSARTFRADVSLAAGNHEVVVAYYENTGRAMVAFSWEPSPVEGGWRGEYYNNRFLSGPAAAVRYDERISFPWGYGPPVDGMRSDNFSVRWTHTLFFEPGLYRFTVRSDDGVRVRVNYHLLIDEWYDQAYQPHSGEIYLEGNVPIKVEYYERTGIAAIWMGWERVDEPPPLPGTVVVDDGDVGFVTGGNRTSWRTVAEGHGGRLMWTRNNDRRRHNYNWARWYPNLPAGRYEVFVYIPERYSTTANARYWISHANGYNLRKVNQSTNGDRWVSLGTYTFRGDGEEYVSLADITYEPYVSRLIAFDAVKWEPR